MNPRRSATMTAILCGMGGVAWLAAFGSAHIENTATPTLDRLAPFLTADFELTDVPRPTAMGNAGSGSVDVARAAELVSGTPTDRTAASEEPKSLVEAASTNSSQMLPLLRALYQRTPKEDRINVREPPKDYYFDSVAGNDGNNCLAQATACASVAKMAALRYAAGAKVSEFSQSW
jgi:hypothetical protein